MKYKPKTYVLVNKTDFFEQLHDEIEYSYADFDQYKMDILECEDIDDLPMMILDMVYKERMKYLKNI